MKASINGIAWKRYVFFFLLLVGSAAAHAGHLFTQAQTNTPISLAAGQQITISQLTYENGGGGANNGRVTVNFSGGGNDTAWSAGDALQITIGAWSSTFTYDTLAATGGTQTASTFLITDATLTAAGLTPSGQIDWVVKATAGKFTFEGYRIYTAGNTFNGTGAGQINQSQVVTTSSGFEPIANSPEVGLARVLDTLTGNVSGQMQAVITALQAMTTASQQQALKIISPERSQVTNQSAINTAASAIDTVQIRLDSLRSGVGLQSSFKTGMDHASLDKGHQEGMSAGNESLDRNFWAKAFGGKAMQDAKGGYAGADSKIYGMMVGHDKVLANGMIAGASLAYARTEADLNDFRAGDSSAVNTYQVTGYFGRSYERWYLEGMLAYAYQQYKTSRNTNLTGVAIGNFDGHLLGSRITAGMPIQLRGSLTLTPFAGIDAYHVRQSSYTESGAGVLSLNVAGTEATRVRSLIGAELASLNKMNDGSVLRPSVKMNWRREYKTSGVNTNASLVGGGGQFESIGQEVNRDVFGLMGRLNWEKTERLSLGIELGVEKGSGYRSIMGQLHGSWRF